MCGETYLHKILISIIYSINRQAKTINTVIVGITSAWSINSPRDKRRLAKLERRKDKTS